MPKALARSAISRPISPRPMMPMVALVERAGAADAGEIAARRVPPVERPERNARAPRCRSTVTRPSSSSSLRASISIRPKTCSAQEMLARRRRVRSLTPFSAQAAVSMLRRPVPNFCRTLSCGAAARSSGPTRKDSTTSAPQSFRLARISSSDVDHAAPRPDKAPPARAARRAHQPAKSGSSVRHEIGEGRAALLARVRIEHERNEPRERIVLDDDDGRLGHCVAAVSSSSARDRP